LDTFHSKTAVQNSTNARINNAISLNEVLLYLSQNGFVTNVKSTNTNIENIIENKYFYDIREALYQWIF
jgi:hypothetical protein